MLVSTVAVGVEMARQDDHSGESRLYTLPAQSSISRISNGDAREMGSLDVHYVRKEIFSIHDT